MNLMTRATFMGAIVLLGASVFGFLGAEVASATPNEVDLSRVCIGTNDNHSTTIRAYIEGVIPIMPTVAAARELCDFLAEMNQCNAGVLRPPRVDEDAGFTCYLQDEIPIDMFVDPWVCYGVVCP